MKKLTTAIGIIIILVVFSVCVLGLVELIRWIVHLMHFLNRADLTVSLPFVAATIGFVGVLVQKHLEKQKDVELSLREKKTKLYDEVMTQHFDMFSQVSQNQVAVLSDENIRSMYNLHKDLILWGSDRVLRKYVDFRYLAVNMQSQSVTPQTYLKTFAELMLAFRKDIGHKNRRLKHEHLLKTFINDYDELFKNDTSERTSTVEN